MKTAVPVTAIWTRRIEDYIETLTEVEGEWRILLRERYDAPMSHIVEGIGIQNSPTSDPNSVFVYKEA